MENLENQLGNEGIVAALIGAIEAAEDQRISFRDYMGICLYQDPYGYYRNEQIKDWEARRFLYELLYWHDYG